MGGWVAASAASDTTAAATSPAEMSRVCPADASAAASASSLLRPVFATILATVSAVISVSTNPGHTALAVTPVPATSAAVDRVRPTSACLAAVYAARYLAPVSPAVEARLTTRPHFRSSMPGQERPSAEERAGGVDGDQPVPLLE